MQKLVAIGSGVSAPQIRDFDVLKGVNTFQRFCWVLATRYSLNP